MTTPPPPGRDPQEGLELMARGPKGETGAEGKRGLSLLQGRAVVYLCLLPVALSLFAIFWVSHSVNFNNAALARQAAAQHAAQVRQSRVIGLALCTTLAKLAELKPPPGDPLTNPARAYDQQLHATLAQLAPDLGCRQ